MMNTPFDPTADRLRYYFNGFLHLKLRNLRSVYRLIEALDFSTGALTCDGKLEVDLIDLCAMDYLRLNMPALADWIHDHGAKFFKSGGLFGRWHSNEEKPKFSTLLPDHLRSDPGVAECYSVLRQLFPGMETSVDLDRAYAHAITHFVCNENYPLALRDEEHFDAYFVFQPNPRKIPEGVFREAWNDLVNGRSERINFSHWSSNRWLVSALRRLDMELSALTDGQRRDLFISLAKHSDFYGSNDTEQTFYGELIWAQNFMESLLKRQPESERGPLLDRLFSEKGALYARLLFLENVWIYCAPEIWPNRQPRPGTPLMSSQRVKDLQAALAPLVESAIARDQFLDHPMLGSRLYRWVNSVGLAYTGPAMRRFQADGRHDLIWKIMRGIARSNSPRFDINFESSMSYADPHSVAASQGFFNELLKFAEQDFWVLFERSQRSIYPSVEMPDQGDACLIQHVRRVSNISVPADLNGSSV